MAHIAEVIKYEGDNSTFIWKHPCEDFNLGSQLIVHESQEAVFMLDTGEVMLYQTYGADIRSLTDIMLSIRWDGTRSDFRLRTTL